MAEEQQDISLNTEQAQEAVRKLTQQFKEYNGTLEKLKSTAVSFNKEGDAIGITLTSLATTGETLTRSYKELEGQLNLTSIAIKGVKDAAQDQFNVMAQLARQGSLLEQNQIKQTKTGRFVQQGRQGFVPKEEVQNLVKQELDFIVEVEKQQEKIVESVEARNREMALLLENGERIRAEAAATNARTAEIEANQERAAELRIKDILEQGTKDQIREQVKQEEAWLDHVEKVHAAQQKELKNLESQANRIRATELEVQDVIERGLIERDRLAAEIAARDKSRQANLQAAQQVPGLIQQGLPNAPFNTAQLNAVQAAIRNISRAVADGKTDVQEVMKIMQAEMQKTGEVFTGTAANIQNQFSRITRAVDQATAAQERLSRAQKIVASTLQFIKFGLMIQGYFALTNAIKQAARDAVTFEIRIAEIQTISQMAAQTTEQWAGQIRTLSDLFGEPSAQVAEGVYETLSNQIAKGADATNFMAQAMKFAVATVSSTADSVNLLSSVLNSYQLDASETERVSAILFKTIDLGRVRASDMADTFGRIGVSAHALGVSLEETAAAIATLTIQGIRPAEAFTQLNAVMVELLKPTKEMQKSFREWGVDSGPTAIKTFSFIGVLDKLSKSTNGSAAEFAKLFNNVRGLRGALGLAGRNLDQYQETLNKITQDALPQYQKAVDIAFQNPGRQITIELNKVRNFFLYDFGRPLIQTALEIGNVFGGGKGLAEGVKNVTAGVKLAVIAWGSYRAAIIAVAAVEKLAEINRNRQISGLKGVAGAASFTANSLKSLVSVQNLVTAALAAAVIIYTKHQANIADVAAAHEQAVNAIAQSYAKLNTAVEFNLTQQTEITRKAIDTQFRAQSQAIAERVRLSNQALDEDKKNVAELTKAVEDATELQTDAIRKQVSELERAFERAKQNAQDARDAAKDIAESFKDENFRFQLDFAEGLDRVKLITDRVSALTKEFHDLLSAPSATPEEGQDNLERALKDKKEVFTLSRDLTKEVNKLTKEREETTKRIAELEAKISGRTDIRSAQQTVRDIRDKQAKLRKQSPLSQQLRGAQQDLAATRTEEAERQEADELHALKEKLLLLEAQLAQYPKLQDATKQLADFEVSAQQGLLDYAAQWDSLADRQKNKLDERREQLKTYQTIIKDLLKFKLPDTISPLANLTGKSGFLGKLGTGSQQILDKIAVESALKSFDELIAKASEFGQIDFSSMSKLVDLRVQLEKQATDKIKADRLKAEAETTQNTQEELKKRVQANQKANTDNINALQQAAAQIGGTLETFQATIKSRQDLGSEAVGRSIIEFERLQKAIPRLQNAFAEFQRGPTTEALDKLQQVFQQFKDTRGAFDQNQFARIAKQFLPGQEPSFKGPGVTFQDLANQFEQQIEQARKAFAARQGIQDERDKLNKDLAAQGLSLKDLLPTIESFDAALREATETLKRFGGAIPQPAQPTAFAQPTPPFSQSTAVTSAGTSFGDIIVNLNGTGNTQADADQIARAIQTRVRLGFVGANA